MNRSADELERALGDIREGRTKLLDSLLSDFRVYLKLFAQAQTGLQLRRHVDPSDVAQDALMDAFQHFDTFRGRTTPELKAWLRQIVMRKLIDRVRYEQADKRDVRRHVALSALSSQTLRRVSQSRASTPSSQASRQEQSLIVAAALERLPLDYREVIILRRFNQLSFQEIGGRMDRTSHASRMLFARAIDRLRLELKRFHHERQF